MKINTILEIYDMISSGMQDVSSRKQAMKLRKVGFNTNSSLVKVAFDTRRINQETEYNPRRGLQNYHRSEPFVSADMKGKITAFSKLSSILDELKSEYGREPEWQDSYVRVLSAAVHKGLRTIQADGDYSDSQPSMASLAYLEELMHVRYRLTPESLTTMSKEDLRKAILGKDELLVNEGVSSSPIIPSDINKLSYESMMEKMMASMAQVVSQMKSQSEVSNTQLKVNSDTSKSYQMTTTKEPSEAGKTVTININV